MYFGSRYSGLVIGIYRQIQSDHPYQLEKHFDSRKIMVTGCSRIKANQTRLIKVNPVESESAERYSGC